MTDSDVATCSHYILPARTPVAIKRSIKLTSYINSSSSSSCSPPDKHVSDHASSCGCFDEWQARTIHEKLPLVPKFPLPPSHQSRQGLTHNESARRADPYDQTYMSEGDESACNNCKAQSIMGRCCDGCKAQLSKERLGINQPRSRTECASLPCVHSKLLYLRQPATQDTSIQPSPQSNSLSIRRQGPHSPPPNCPLSELLQPYRHHLRPRNTNSVCPHREDWESRPCKRFL